jgi:hypothetical protein
MMRVCFAVLLMLGVTMSLASAEIEKIAIPGENGFSLHWWPKLGQIAAWHHDRGVSLGSSANILVPDGFSVESAETMMYARALYKERIPEIHSIEELIESYKAKFLDRIPDLKIEEVAPMMTGDQAELRSFTFTPTSQGNWERVSFGEEGDFYLLFVISSRSQDGYGNSVEPYRQMIGTYKEKH